MFELIVSTIFGIIIGAVGGLILTAIYPLVIIGLSIYLGMYCHTDLQIGTATSWLIGLGVFIALSKILIVAGEKSGVNDLW